MQLSDEQIQGLITAWKADFGEVLSPEQARTEATRLLDFFGKFADGLTRIRKRSKEAPSSDTIT
jgi:hypothetical protein